MRRGFFLFASPVRLRHVTARPCRDGSALAPAGGRRARLLRVLKQNQKAALPEVLERDDFQVHGAGVAVLIDPHIFFAHCFVFLLRLVDGGAQRQHQAFPRHLEHVEARLAGGRLQIGARRPTELQDLQLGVDQHAGRSELVDGDAVGFALGVESRGNSSGGSGGLPYRQGLLGPFGRISPRSFYWQMERRRGRGFLRIDFVLFVHRLKQVGEGADGLGRAQEQESLRLERVMEGRE